MRFKLIDFAVFAVAAIFLFVVGVRFGFEVARLPAASEIARTSPHNAPIELLGTVIDDGSQPWPQPFAFEADEAWITEVVPDDPQPDEINSVQEIDA